MIKGARSAHQVRQTRLMQRRRAAAIRRPPVSHQDAVKVGAQHLGRLVEAAPVANAIHRSLRRGKRPQPVPLRADPPAGLVGAHDGTAADLCAQRGVGRGGHGGPRMQHLHEPPGRHRQPEASRRSAAILASGMPTSASAQSVRRRSAPGGRWRPPPRPRSAADGDPARGARTVCTARRPHERQTIGRTTGRSSWSAASRAAVPPPRRTPDTPQGAGPRRSHQPWRESGGAPGAHTAAGSSARLPAVAGTDPWRTARPAGTPPAARLQAAAAGARAGFNRSYSRCRRLCSRRTYPARVAADPAPAPFALPPSAAARPPRRPAGSARPDRRWNACAHRPRELMTDSCE